MSKKHICSYCQTEIDWDCGDDQKGAIWGCDDCCGYFCESCFKERHGAESLHTMLGAESEEDILCPDCYENKEENEDANIDFTCDTEDCIYWADGVCCKGTSVKIEEHHCVDYEERVVSNRNFASDARMKEIANKSIDYFGESLTGKHLYECLTGVLGMTNEEILAADFTTLKCYMEDDTDD